MGRVEAMSRAAGRQNASLEKPDGSVLCSSFIVSQVLALDLAECVVQRLDIVMSNTNSIVSRVDLFTPLQRQRVLEWSRSDLESKRVRIREFGINSLNLHMRQSLNPGTVASRFGSLWNLAAY